MAQVAQSLFLTRDVEGLKKVAATVKDRREDVSGTSYVVLADYLEQLGLAVERNQVLTEASQFVPGLAPFAEQVRTGKLSAQTLRETWNTLPLP